MLDVSMEDEIPAGFKLRHMFQDHKKINRIAWSPDGQILASASRGETILLWNVKTGKLQNTFEGNFNYSLAWSPDGRTLASAGVLRITLWNAETGEVQWKLRTPAKSTKSISWSPNGQILASGSDDGMIRFWNVESWQLLRTLTAHSLDVNSVTWSPDGTMLASGSNDNSIRLWDVETGKCIWMATEHFGSVNSIAWSPDGTILASASSDNTVRFWEPNSGRQIGILEGHTAPVICISFSSNSRLLASKSLDGTVRLWRSDNLERVRVLDEPALPYGWYAGLAFHPKTSTLATLGEKDTVIRIWKLDLATILGDTFAYSVHYANAKVVLVGDGGVGKSGLSLVLSKQPYALTESTHGLHVWPFDTHEIELDDGRKETHETFLWDLAGQPGYRLIHQLHLNDVSVALIVFDARGETDPFAGVRHWDSALRLVQRIQNNPAVKLNELLVAARMDRGRSVSRNRVDSLVEELGIVKYIETSAKEGWHIVELTEEIKRAIDWDVLPKVSSTDLFQQIKNFLVEAKKEGQLLSTVGDLYYEFLKSDKTLVKTEELGGQFETCIRSLESQGLLQRLSFGILVLLKPEVLDTYASALIDAVNSEPDGMGSISEEKVKEIGFFIPKDERLKNKKEEELLLIAMIEDLLRHEIALREWSDDGSYLIFPSQCTRENPDLSNPEGQTIVFGFKGPILNVYTTLAVRLSHSGVFKKKDLSKDAITYTYPEDAEEPGTYGVLLRNHRDGYGELALFFDKNANKETNKEMRLYFERFIYTHLQRRAIAESIQRWRIFTCPACREPFTESAVRHRRERGFDKMKCGVCETDVSILESEEQLTVTDQSRVSDMDSAADAQREHEASISVLRGSSATKSLIKGEFDVFLCHNNEDKPEVKRIGKQLKDKGIAPWLDEEQLRPGLPWQPLLEEQIGKIKTAAVFVGKSGLGPWQKRELYAFLNQFVNRGCPVIPVLLKDASQEPELPPFLRDMTWVDFRTQEDLDKILEGSLSPMDRLIWGITGEPSLV